ncbi:hypothetical protein Ancab_018578 [Ancistrocladus abbreviatus]
MGAWLGSKGRSLSALESTVTSVIVLGQIVEARWTLCMVESLLRPGVLVRKGGHDISFGLRSMHLSSEWSEGPGLPKVEATCMVLEAEYRLWQTSFCRLFDFGWLADFRWCMLSQGESYCVSF